MKITPENIVNLRVNEVFVFGSNLAGRHGKGAALSAKRLFGAQDGVGFGFTGNCYAIPTKDARLNSLVLEEIKKHIRNFLYDVSDTPYREFLVTKIGCGFAGYSPADIAPLFGEKEDIPPNVSLPIEF